MAFVDFRTESPVCVREGCDRLLQRRPESGSLEIGGGKLLPSLCASEIATFSLNAKPVSVARETRLCKGHLRKLYCYWFLHRMNSN